jgi:YidC/Oxa1 family membrane protein insertase
VDEGQTPPSIFYCEDFTVDPFNFPPIAAVLDAAYGVVIGLTHLIHPLVGASAAAVAIVLITIAVRAALIPVGASQVKAEWGRRRLAPQLLELQRRHKKNPPKLQQKTMELYKNEGVNPFGGMLPALAQAPIVSIVYALFIRGTVGGQQNALLSAELLGVPLGAHALTPGAIGLFAVLLTVMAVVAWITRRTTLRLALPGQAVPPLLTWLPFITVVFASLVPLAATIYLTVSTAWTLGERALLRRRYWHR